MIILDEFYKLVFEEQMMRKKTMMMMRYLDHYSPAGQH
jgi:hypothetical protein